MGGVLVAALAPIKIARETDELVSHAAHFLSKSKKDVVDAAVREYIDAHRDDINAGVKTAMSKLDGTKSSAVSLLTGMSVDDLNKLGGLAD